MNRSPINRTALLVAAASAIPALANAQSATGLPVSGIASGSGKGSSAPVGSARDRMNAARGEDLLSGNGSRLGYTLTHGNVVTGSESVTVNGVRLTPGNGYTLDAASGSITFTQPVRSDQSIVVRYRYLPGTTAGGAIMALPSLAFSGGGSRYGLSFGVNRSDDGKSTMSLVGLRSESTGSRGLSGLLYLSGGAVGSAARSLVGDAKPDPTPAAGGGGHLIDQTLRWGDSRSSFSASYQDVSREFSGWAALRGGNAAPADALARLEKEKGMKRLGFSGNLKIGGGALGFSHSDLSESGQGIRRQGLTLETGGLSLKANLLSVDQNFTRFKDIADNDRDALSKLKGGKRFDLAGTLKLSSALRFEGSMLDQTLGKEDLKTQRTLLAYAPKTGPSFSFLQESSVRDQDGKSSGTATQVMELRHRFGKAGAPGALDLQFKRHTIDSFTPNAPDRDERNTTWVGAYQVARNARVSFNLFSQDIVNGSVRNATDRSDWGLEFGRGYRLRQLQERGNNFDGRNWGQRRILQQQLTLDPSLPLTFTGERREYFEGERSEKSGKWNARLAMGSLSLRTEGYEIRRNGMNEPSEDAYTINGSLALSKVWKVGYTAFDRDNREQNKIQRNESGSEISVAGTVGGMQVAFRDLAYDDRTDDTGRSERQEVSLVPLKPMSIGPLRKAKFTVGFGTLKVGDAAKSNTYKLNYETNVAGTRVAVAYDDAGNANGTGSTAKSLVLETDPKKRLHIGAQYGIKQVAGQSNIVSRKWDIDLKIARNQTLSYDYARNQDRPDGRVDPISSEKLAYTADLGKGGRFAASYNSAQDREKRTVVRVAAVTLLSPTSATTACELLYSQESRLTVGQQEETQTFGLKYLFDPGTATRVELGAKWIERRGSKVRPADDEAQANVDVQMGL